MSSKKKDNHVAIVVVNDIEYHSGQILAEKDFAIMEGNIMAIIECIGVPNKQEEAIKSQIRQCIYRPLRHTTSISAQEHADLIKVKR